jgi:hypothetical protein
LASGGPCKAIRNSVTVLNVDVEVDIRVKRDWLTSKRRMSECITPSVVSRTCKSGLSSLFELRNGKIPALEDFTSAKTEKLGVALTFRLRVGDKSVVHQSGSPGNRGPVTSFTVIARSGFTDINSNVGKVLRRTVVLVIGTIRTINIWSFSRVNLDRLNKAD